jgi:hypothetical protein
VPFEDGKHPGGRPAVARRSGRVDLSSRPQREAHDAARAELEAAARERMLSHARIKLTPEMIDEICEKLPTGNYPSVIAESLGVTSATFLKWMREGRTAWETQDAPETSFSTSADPLALRVELYLRVTQAEAGWEVDLVEEMDWRIRENKSWAGHMTMLQRRKPDRWDARGRNDAAGEKSWEEKVAEIEAERAKAATPTPAL